MSDNPNIVYGKLSEATHISGYSLGRAIGELEWLLDEDRWKRVGAGYTDINDFLKTLNFSEFKLAIEQRKDLAKRLADLDASQRATARMLGVSKDTIRNDVGENSPPEINPIIDIEAITEDTGENSPPAPVPEWMVGAGIIIPEKQKRVEQKIKERKAIIEETKKKIETDNLTVDGVYDVIVIDPPWAYGREYDPENSRVANPYPEMGIDEIGAIHIPAKDDCVMFLWTTHAFLRNAFDLLDVWGFTYKATLVWDKGKMGMGNTIRMQCEFCLLATKGSPLITGSAERDIIREDRREHSRKPNAFYKLVRNITTGRRIDYFSREDRPGFVSFGAETNKF